MKNIYLIKFNEERSSTLRKLGASAKVYLISTIILFLFGCASTISQKTDPESVNIDKLYSPEELKEDLDFLFQTMENVHPNLYFYTTNEIIDNDRYNLEQSFNKPQTALEFWKLTGPIISKLGDGHTSLFLPWRLRKYYVENNGLIVPFKIYIDNGQMFVNANYTKDSTFAINTKILSINNMSSQSIVNNLIAHKSGERIENRYRKVARDFAQYLWGLYRFENQFDVQYISSNDSLEYSKIFNGITLDSLIAQQNITQDNSQKTPYSFKLFSSEKVGIIDFNAFNDLKRFKKFSKDIFNKIKLDTIQNLIIDLRGNPGGNSLLGNHLFSYLINEPYSAISRIETKASKETRKSFKKRYLKWYLYPLYPILFFHSASKPLFGKKIGQVTISKYKPVIPKKNPLRFEGNIYLLTDSISFSAASGFASVFKCHNIGIIIGEETGGLTASYGDVIRFKLPNTEIQFQVSYKYIVEPCSKEDGHGVIPDYEVKQTPEDREKGIDTVMEFTKQLIRESESIGN